jgi:poly(A) polymerase
MKENPLFRTRYLRSMAALNRETNRPANGHPEEGGHSMEGGRPSDGYKNLPGESLGALINDYLEDTTEWEKGVTENYKESFAAARRFVLPMNPPRFELAFAVRRFFAAHGVTVKKSHVTDISGRRRTSHPADAETATVLQPENRVTENKPKRKRKRKKKKKPMSNEQGAMSNE